MGGKRNEIGAVRFDIKASVCRRLAGIHDDECSRGARDVGDLPHGIHNPQHVRNGRDGHNAGPLGQDRHHGVNGQLATVRDGGDTNDRARLMGDFLPRDQVRVMFRFGHDNFIASGQRESCWRTGSRR